MTHTSTGTARARLGHHSLSSLCLCASVVKVLLLVSTLAATTASADSITLRAAARLEKGAPVTLADVADLAGPDAQRLGALTLAPRPIGQDGPFEEVTLTDIRDMLEKRAEVRWSTLTLRGSTCTIRRLSPRAAPERIAEHQPPSVPVPGIATLRDLIPTRLAELLSVSVADLRLTYHDSDADLLNETVAGRTADIQPAAMSDRLPLTICIYEGDRIAASGSIRVEVKVRRDVLVNRAAIAKGANLTEDMFRPESRWIGPALKPALLTQVEGKTVRARLEPGVILQASDIEAPLAVKKGDTVAIHCVSGAIVIQTKARALAPARDGEVIPFQALDSRRVFHARVSGPGRAVVTDAPAPSPSTVTPPTTRPTDERQP